MLTELSQEIAAVVEAAAPSVVQVIGHRRPASGLVFDKGVVLTTMSAVRREDGLQVRPAEGDAHAAELAGWDPTTGLAVLRATGLDAAPMSPSTTPVRVGHIGIALGRSWSNAVTASSGIVAIVGGPLRTGPRRAIDQVFRTTAPMHDGFAGGAFLDAGGQLIGIVTARAIRGLGVVIPASIAWKSAGYIIEHGRTRRGYLGVAGQSVTLPEHQRGKVGRERGMLVCAVINGGPAATAGVLVGDVLLTLDGTPVESPEELLDLLETTSAGRPARLQVLRAGASSELMVTVGERPAS